MVIRIQAMPDSSVPTIIRPSESSTWAFIFAVMPEPQNLL